MHAKKYIAIISDMHLAPIEAGTERQQSTLDMPERRAGHLNAVFEQLQAGPRPEAVLFGGDNTNQPVSRDNFRKYGHEFMMRFRKFAPCHAIPGNHDVGSTIGWGHHDAAKLDEACNAFCIDWQEWWKLDLAGFTIIAINTQIFGSGLARAKEQEFWLREQLKQPTAGIKTVFAHTPLYLKNQDEDFSDGSEQMCLKPQARQPLVAILNEHPPQLLITTHAHRFWISRQGAWDWLGIPATALGQDEMNAVPAINLPDGDDHVGWVRLGLTNGGAWEARMCCC